jgi:hypothetical protein
MLRTISAVVLLGCATTAAASEVGDVRLGGSTILYVPSSLEARGELFLGEKASVLAGGGLDVATTLLSGGESLYGRARTQARFYAVGDHDDGWHASAGVGLWADMAGRDEPLWLVPISVGLKNPDMVDVSITYNFPMFMDEFLGSDPQAALALPGMLSVDLHFAL